MRKLFYFFLIVVSLSLIVLGDSVINGLSKGQADTLYCAIGVGCGATGSAENPFNQTVNTTSNVTVNRMNVKSGRITLGLDTQANHLTILPDPDAGVLPGVNYSVFVPYAISGLLAVVNYSNQWAMSQIFRAANTYYEDDVHLGNDTFTGSIITFTGDNVEFQVNDVYFENYIKRYGDDNNNIQWNNDRQKYTVGGRLMFDMNEGATDVFVMDADKYQFISAPENQSTSPTNYYLCLDVSQTPPTIYKNETGCT